LRRLSLDVTTQLKKKKRMEEFNDGPDVTAPLKTGSLVLVPRFTTSAGNFFSPRREWALCPLTRKLRQKGNDRKRRRRREMAVPYCAARDSFVVQSSTPTEVYFTVRWPIVG
jgi:hypothetical protein